jgi:hypothetical protein
MEFQFDNYDERNADFWDNEFEDDYQEYEAPQFVAEMGAFERVAHKKIMRMDLSGPEKLRLLLDDYSNKYREKEFWPITEDDMEKIYKYVSQLNEPGFKNPVGYMLGYYIVDRRGKIDKERFNKVIEDVLPRVQNDIFIKPEDVIRYARLWNNLL